MKILNKKRFRLLALLSGVVLITLSCGSDQEEEVNTSGVVNSGSTNIGLIDDKRILEAESEPGNWLAHGRTYEENRFSPLTKINKENVSDLALALSLIHI